MRDFRLSIVANPSLHFEANHQFAYQIQAYRINRSRMAESESTRYPHRCILKLDLNNMPTVIHHIKRRSLHRRRLFIELDVWMFPYGFFRFGIICLSSASFDAKRLETHDNLPCSSAGCLSL